LTEPLRLNNPAEKEEEAKTTRGRGEERKRMAAASK